MFGISGVNVGAVLIVIDIVSGMFVLIFVFLELDLVGGFVIEKFIDLVVFVLLVLLCEWYSITCELVAVIGIVVTNGLVEFVLFLWIHLFVVPFVLMWYFV